MLLQFYLSEALALKQRMQHNSGSFLSSSHQTLRGTCAETEDATYNWVTTWHLIKLSEALALKQRMQHSIFHLFSVKVVSLRGTCAETEDATDFASQLHCLTSATLRGTCAETEDATFLHITSHKNRLELSEALALKQRMQPVKTRFRFNHI